MKLSWLFVILLLLLVSLFSVQNAELITVRFMVWQFQMSAALVIQIAAVVGAMVGLLVGAFSGRKSRHAGQRESYPVPPEKNLHTVPALMTPSDSRTKPTADLRD
jgi:uncharacterized integral membrane protein